MALPAYTVEMHSILDSPLPVPFDMTVQELALPIGCVSVRAGFPSPADDFVVERLDIMKLLVKHPQATYFWRVRGDSMREAGIDDGSIIAVDRAIRPVHGCIVVALVDGECTVKFLHQRAGRMKLRACAESRCRRHLQPAGRLGLALVARLNDGCGAFIWMAAQGRPASIRVALGLLLQRLRACSN